MFYCFESNDLMKLKNKHTNTIFVRQFILLCEPIENHSQGKYITKNFLNDILPILFLNIIITDSLNFT